MAVGLIWGAGLSLGVAADRFYGEAFRACLLLAPHQIPSFLGTMCVNVLPLLISAYAVSFFPMAVYSLCLFRGVLTGAGISALASLFSEAGGMMCFFLLFSLLVYSPVLMWYWFRMLRDPSSFRRDTTLCIAIGIGVAFLDRGIIAPLLQEIMIF